MATRGFGSVSAADDPSKPELVFGLIGALGANIADTETFIRARLGQLGYSLPDTIKLSELLRDLKGPRFDALRVGSGRAHVSLYMDAGNELRSVTGRGEAVALLGVNRLRRIRRDMGFADGKTAGACAFILNSLKHPAEVQALREIYGPAFVAVAVFNQRSERIPATELRLVRHYGRGEPADYVKEAADLVQRDEDEQRNPYGQHVSDAFALADVVVGKSGRRDLEASTNRFVELLFGRWTHTPTSDETGMYHAQGARYRSASMARQVGAAITRHDGAIVATGMNEVPKAGGGLYGEADDPDGRDHALPQHQDSSDFYKREVIVDFLDQLRGLDLLRETDPQKIVPLADGLLRTKALKNAKFLGTIDYVRAVHAEAAALMDAARHGAAVRGCTLYTTTFPCHDCTKHLVAAGIMRVVFIEPYTKSLTSKLFADSVAIDDSADSGKVQFAPFIGVMPRRYADIFEMHGDRKTVEGLWKEWTAQEARPILGDYAGPAAGRLIAEDVQVGQFNRILENKGLA